MALQKAKLTSVVFIQNPVSAIYTNPAATKTLVRGFILHNTNTTPEVVTINWVDAVTAGAGTAAAGNRIFKVTIPADETLILEVPFSLVMEDEDETIQMLSTTTNKVTAAVLGDQDT